MSNKRTNARYAGRCAVELSQWRKRLEKLNPFRPPIVPTPRPRLGCFMTYGESIISRVARTLGIPKRLVFGQTSRFEP